MSIHNESSSIDGEEVGNDVGGIEGLSVGRGVGRHVRFCRARSGALEGLEDGFPVG